MITYDKFLKNLNKSEIQIKNMVKKDFHYCYILKCQDNTFYTGYAKDPIKRLYEHNYSKKGAKYTKNRRPVQIIKIFEFDCKSDALSFEFYFKKLSKKEKIKIIES